MAMPFAAIAAILACGAFPLQAAPAAGAGAGPVDLARASALAPSAFTTLAVGATGAIVVRATACAGVAVNGGRSIPTNISQIGVEIVPPDGTGDINNYTLIYVSNNAELVAALNRAGVPAAYDRSLTYQFTYDVTGSAGELYVEAEGVGLPPYFLTGTETDPTGAGSNFPDIAFGTASISLHTDRDSALGQLIGGNSDADYHFLPVRGVYASAHMQVTLSER